MGTVQGEPGSRSLPETVENTGWSSAISLCPGSHLPGSAVGRFPPALIPAEPLRALIVQRPNRVLLPAVPQREYFCEPADSGRQACSCRAKRHYKKWLDPDNLPPQFRKGAISPPVIASHDADVYHIIKQGLDPEISPLLAEDDVLRLNPPTFILTCEFDVLRDDGILFQKRLKDVGVDVKWEHLSDGFHGIISFFNQGWLTFESSQRGMDSVVRYVKTL